MAEQDKMRDYADTVWNNFAVRFARINEVYAMTRFRVAMRPGVQGRDIQNAPLAEAWSILSQLLAFFATPRVTVLPKDNSAKEDEDTTKIEQWFAGYPLSLPFVQMHPFVKYMHNYGETGIGALLLEFDDGRALEGKFPFRVTAPAPESLAFQFGEERLVCAVIREEREAAGLYQDLQTRYEEAKKLSGKSPKWSIPQALTDAYEKMPTLKVQIKRLWTEDAEFFWVQDERLWERPLLVKGVPLDLGFCNPIPSDRAEEYGLGLIWHVIPMLMSNQRLLDKALTGFSFFTHPQERVYYNDGTVELRQVKPGSNYTNVAKVEDVPVHSNYESLQLLSETYKTSIGKATIQDVTFGEGKDTSSGYQVNLLQEGPRRRITSMIGEAGGLSGASLGMVAHDKRVMRYIEWFANEEQAKKLGAHSDEQIKTYLNAFGTVAAPPDSPEKKKKARVVLASKDVKGYDALEVDLMPEEPADENAKYQRAQLAQQVGMSREGVFRNVLEVEKPDQELAWQKDDMLMNDPMWQEFTVKKAIKDKLNKDPQLAAEFAEFVAAKQASMPPPVTTPEAPPAMSEAEMAMAGAQTPQDAIGMGTGVMPQDMAGMSSSNLPPAMMGQGQPDPALVAMQQSFGG